MLEEVGTLVTPETLLRWHRQLIAAKWDYSQRRQQLGRPRVSQELVELVLQMARENPTWGYDRIQGALANLGHKTSEVNSRQYLEGPGRTENPHDLWMMQVARNLSDASDGFLGGKKYVLMDRDTKFSETFRSILESSGVQSVRLPPRSPNLTPHLER